MAQTMEQLQTSADKLSELAVKLDMAKRPDEAKAARTLAHVKRHRLKQLVDEQLERLY